MDTSDPHIVFDEKGICNHCKSFDEKLKLLPLDESAKKTALEKVVAKIKADGKGKEYDCISGVSGGVDSTYLTYMLKQLGLRTLIVHVDNGWNSELAVNNIENLIKNTGFDLYTKVLNWEEFRQLQLAYLKASVIDLEALTDHAIYATLMNVAAKEKIKYIINGSNFATEGILPLSWRYDEKLTDDVNIKAIYKMFGKGKLIDFPLLSIQRFAYLTKVKRIQVLDLLNLMHYNKDEAKRTIMEKLGWRDYGGKHNESIITRFYQGYILPKKFGIDKRRAHLATLIATRQITRNEALEELKKPIIDETLLKQDLEYVPKKLGLTKSEFEEIMNFAPKKHNEYATNKKTRDLLFSINKNFKVR